MIVKNIQRKLNEVDLKDFLITLFLVGLVLFSMSSIQKKVQADTMIGNSIDIPFTFHYNNAYGFTAMNTVLKLQLIKSSAGHYGIQESIVGNHASYVKQYVSGNVVLTNGEGRISAYLLPTNFSGLPKNVPLTQDQVNTLRAAIQSRSGYFYLANLADRGPWQSSGQILTYAANISSWSGINLN